MMKKSVLFLSAILLLLAPSVFAEPIPDYESVLQKDYNECMGGNTAQQDPQRNEYCNCVRQDMRGWSLDANGNIVIEGSKVSTSQEVQDKVQEIAKACVAKILK